MRLALCSLVLLAACTSHEVRCDAHLLPINLPAPAQVAEGPAARVPSAKAPIAGTAATGTPTNAAPATAAPVTALQGDVQ